jgi:hypothetical protein
MEFILALGFSAPWLDVHGRAGCFTQRLLPVGSPTFARGCASPRGQS